MKKTITTLYLVLAASKIYAQDILQYNDPYCKNNKTEVIHCEADGKYQYSQQKIQIEIHNRSSCYYYRYTDYGFWSLDIKVDQQPLASLGSVFDFNSVYLQNYPWNFSVSELSANKPFEIEIDSNSILIKKFKIYDSVKGACKPGSALSDDDCNQKSYSIVTERMDIENLNCQ